MRISDWSSDVCSSDLFEEARAQLEGELAEVARERAFNELTGKLVDQALKNPSALAPAANAVGLPLQKLGPFSRENGTGIAASPAVVREAFSEELIQDGTVSNPIAIAPGPRDRKSPRLHSS